MFKHSAVITSLLISTSAFANQVIFPAEGQSPEQQQKDTADCSAWAIQNSGYNPANPPAAPIPTQAAQPSGPTGSRLRGAAAGALVSEVVDGNNTNAAIAGAVIGGARERRRNAAAAQQVQTANAQQQQAYVAEKNAGQAIYDKSQAACLEGKGYSVK